MDVGVDDRGGPGGFHPLGQVGGGEGRGFQPASGGDHAVAGINPDRHLAGKLGTKLGGEVGLFHGDRAKNHAGDTQIQQFGRTLTIAHPTAHLDLGHRAIAPFRLIPGRRDNAGDRVKIG